VPQPNAHFKFDVKPLTLHPGSATATLADGILLEITVALPSRSDGTGQTSTLPIVESSSRNRCRLEWGPTTVMRLFFVNAKSCPLAVPHMTYVPGPGIAYAFGTPLVSRLSRPIARATPSVRFPLCTGPDHAVMAKWYCQGPVPSPRCGTDRQSLSGPVRGTRSARRHMDHFTRPTVQGSRHVFPTDHSPKPAAGRANRSTQESHLPTQLSDRRFLRALTPGTRERFGCGQVSCTCAPHRADDRKRSAQPEPDLPALRSSPSIKAGCLILPICVVTMSQSSRRQAAYVKMTARTAIPIYGRSGRRLRSLEV
jgi:hypothetical protein